MIYAYISRERAREKKNERDRKRTSAFFAPLIHMSRESERESEKTKEIAHIVSFPIGRRCITHTLVLT